MANSHDQRPTPTINDQRPQPTTDAHGQRPTATTDDHHDHRGGGDMWGTCGAAVGWHVGHAWGSSGGAQGSGGRVYFGFLLPHLPDGLIYLVSFCLTSDSSIYLMSFCLTSDSSMYLVFFCLTCLIVQYTWFSFLSPEEYLIILFKLGRI